MKSKISYFFTGSNHFTKEFKRQLRMMIILTLGFTVAFTWRQTVFDISQSIVRLFIHIETNSLLSIFTSLFITFISLFLIYLTSHYLKESKGKNY